MLNIKSLCGVVAQTFIKKQAEGCNMQSFSFLFLNREVMLSHKIYYSLNGTVLAPKSPCQSPWYYSLSLNRPSIYAGRHAQALE